MTLFREAGDNERADRLQHHINLTTHAETLTESSISAIPQGTLEVAVKGLQTGGVELPPSVQMAIFRRKLAQTGEASLNTLDVKPLLQLTLPWSSSALHGPETNETREFDGLDPRVSTLDGRVQEKGPMFEYVISTIISTLLRQGESYTGKAVRVCEDILQLLQEIADEDGGEPFDDNVNNIEVSARVVV